MLLVRTKLASSKIEGLGLFADEFIPQGTLVQRFAEGIDSEIPLETVGGLESLPQETMMHFCHRHKRTGNYILCADNARFLNHSDAPNLSGGDSLEEIDIALRDIEKDEELTVNYYEFDADASSKLS